MRISAMLVVTMAMLAFPVLAQTPQLLGEPHDVHVGPGDQSDPHLSGSLVAYSSVLEGNSEIRFQLLGERHSVAIPTGGAVDLLSDVSGTRIVFTRIGASSSAIMSYDVATDGPAIEVAPEPGSNRRGAVIGGPTIVWLDFTQGGGRAVLTAWTEGLQDVVPLSDASGLVRDPAVSPDGQVVVWTRCEQDGTGCAIHQAQRQGGVWSSSTLASLGEASLPDTNGALVVYSVERFENGKRTRDLYWQPVGGGPERRLPLEGDDHNPNVAGRFIAFERMAPDGSGAADIALYDLDSGWLYQLTNTPEGESLNDVSVTPDGTVHVVWTAPGTEGLDVRGMSLRLQAPQTCAPVATGCANPWNRPLLATVVLERTCGPKARQGVDFELASSEEGLLCVRQREASSDVTAAWVWVDGRALLDPSDFKHGVEAWERPALLDAGKGRLEVALAGAPGGGLEVRLHGAATCPRREPMGRSRVLSGAGASQPVPGTPVVPTDGLAGSSPAQLSGPGAMGCDAGGAAAVAPIHLLLLSAGLLVTARPRTLFRLRVRRRHR